MKPECPMKPEVVWGTSYALSEDVPASNVLILGRDDMLEMAEGTHNFWLTEDGKTTGQGFIMKVDTCPRVITNLKLEYKSQSLKKSNEGGHLPKSKI